MKLLLVIAPENFRDEELEVPRTVFDRNGIAYDIASTKTGTCSGMLGATAEASLVLDDAVADEYAGIVIVGGVGSQDHLWDNETLHALVRTFFESGKVVAAICLSPVVLARAGVLKGRQATVFRSPASVREMEKGGAMVVDIPVVADMDLITAAGPAVAESFAEEILDRLGC
jgi:protease I